MHDTAEEGQVEDDIVCTVTAISPADSIGARRPLDAVDKTPQPIVAGLAYREQLTLLVAREGGGKSTLARQAAARLTRGRHWLTGASIPKGRVLWLSSEETPAQVDAGMWDLPGDYDPLAVYYAPLDAVETPEALRAAIVDLRVDLVVIDPIGDLVLRTVDERDYAKVRQSMSEWTRALGTAGALALHHSHRERDSRQRDAIGNYYGSVGLASSCVLMLEMEFCSKLPSDPRRDLTVNKSRIISSPRGQRVLLTWQDCEGYSERPADSPAGDDLARKLGALLAKHPGMTKTAAAAALGIPRGGNLRFKALLDAWPEQ